MDYMQMAGSGAAVLVAEMARSGWAAVRDTVVRFFRRGGERAVEEEMRLVEEARRRLVESAEDERDSVAEQVQGQLTIQLAAFLQKHPGAIEELRALVDLSKRTGTGSGTHVTANNNQQSQVIISGGSISADGGFHNRTPEDER
ncbi:hypothetical protein [Streptomyces sp. B22F1]|uniref:hypothetical protein n=1 Tax=Streptomyces sp. B22F1 TaxID=3153566 RepID=UPI00325CA161